MKLIKQISLYFQDDRSDKVYEVDLCQVREDSYLVNFRYGRRGSNLKDGTKTDVGVPLAQAEKIFDKLVAEKVKKGYLDVTASQALTSQPNLAVGTAVSDRRQQAVLNRLAGGDAAWPLERAIWRAGELKIAEATPFLIELIGTGEPLRDYCIAWALGWCGDMDTIPTLANLCQNPSTPEFVARIAWEARWKLAGEEVRSQWQSEAIGQLPPPLRELAENGSAEAFFAALKTYLDSADSQGFAVLYRLYQIDNEFVRPALIKTLSTAPFRPNYFKSIRHIFKSAEYRRDAEVFAIIAGRLEIEPAMFKSQSWNIALPDGSYLHHYQTRYNPATGSNEYVDTQFRHEMKRPNARLAYSNKTRDYLRRRVWRTLKQLGEEGDINYVKMASQLLLQYSDADAKPVKQTTIYRYNPISWTAIQENIDWDAYAGYLTFNHILYENSVRYCLKPNSQAWRCQEGYKPGDSEPEGREEAFPELWEQHPDVLLQLLLKSQCRLVHEFAAKALGSCQQFWAGIEPETLIKLLGQPYEVTAELGFNLVVSGGYHRHPVNWKLILAVANSCSEKLRKQAYIWIEEQGEYFLDNSQFIAALVVSKKSDTRQFARRFLSLAIVNDTRAKVLIGQIIIALLSLDSGEGELVKEVGETLLLNFTLQLRHFDLNIILYLLRYPMPEIQELGARILLNHETPAVNLPPNLIESLLDSPYERVRVVGVRLFGQLPDEMLMGSQRILIVAMAVNSVAEIRSAIQPIIRRLAGANREFSMNLAGELMEVLNLPERSEGVHGYLVRLLREDIPGWVPNVSKEMALGLVRSPASAAQELGGFVLGENARTWAAEFDTIEMVKLANHEILSVREAGRKLFLESLNRIRTHSQEMLAAVRMLEAKWEDSRQFATEIFRDEFTLEAWTPEVMVSICDSVREDVRQFGRDLVTRTFQEAYGQDYLLKFSEHPSADMQLFATNYLESYAGGNPERLRELMPFFISVLSRVNKGRVAKQRVFAFLEKEAEKSEAAARVVAEILSRQSATIAIGDKAAAIQTMLKIHRNYPHLSLPIQVKVVSEVRS